MKITKIVAVVLSMAMLNFTLPTAAFADGAKAGEAMEYAQREAEAVGLENFEGGCVVHIGLGVVALLAVVYYYFFYLEGSQENQEQVQGGPSKSSP